MFQVNSRPLLFDSWREAVCAPHSRNANPTLFCALVQRFLANYNTVFVGVEKVPRNKLYSAKTDTHAALAFIRLDRLNRVGSSCFYTDFHFIDDRGVPNTTTEGFRLCASVQTSLNTGITRGDLLDEYSSPAVPHG